MTVDKREQITLPAWFVSVLVSLVFTGLATWGIISAKAAMLEVRATHNELNIEILRKEKVSRDELNLILDKLNNLDKKFDDYIKK